MSLHVSAEKFSSELKLLKRNDAYKYLGLSDLPMELIESKYFKKEASNAIHKSPFSTEILEALPAKFKQDLFFELALQQSQVQLQEVQAQVSQKWVTEFKLDEDFSSRAWVVVLGEGAKLNWVIHDQNGLEGIHFQRVCILGKRDSELKLTLVQSGGGKTQTRVLYQAIESGASFQMHTLQVSKKNQALDAWVEVEHLAPHTQSELLSWSIAQDQAKSIFNGQVTIDQKAPFSDSNQRNKNIILSPKAEACSFPKLLISQNEVKAAHGSSVSSFNPDSLIYLRMRGIDQKEAEQMMLRGFIHLPLEWIEDEKTRQNLETILLGQPE